LKLLFVLPFILIFQNMQPLQIGDKVPDFTLTDQDGNPYRLYDHLGKGYLVIYFYPKDDTPGCTKEACSFRDNYQEFVNSGTQVIGISADPVEKHSAFIEKYNLPFTLLSDSDNTVRLQFGVKPDFFGMIPGRVTFIVNAEGKIVHVFKSQLNATKHVDEALEFIKSQ
jgi:thioredoxin-dependent peroxiredoxin